MHCGWPLSAEVRTFWLFCASASCFLCSAAAASCMALTFASSFHPGMSARLHWSSCPARPDATPFHLHPSTENLQQTGRKAHSDLRCLSRVPRVSAARHGSLGHATGSIAIVCSASVLRTSLLVSSWSRQVGHCGRSSAQTRS